MNVYIFDRGKFGKWKHPMWAGETRALKFIRLLKKQNKNLKIIYEEGPLIPYDIDDYAKEWSPFDTSYYHKYNEQWNNIYKRISHGGKAPKYFKVSF